MNKLPVKVHPKELSPKRYEDDSLFETLSAFESETAGVLMRTAPKNERVILHVMILMLVLAVGLSAVVKLDRVVTGGGKVVPVGGPLYVSPLTAGVVRDVRVKPGQIVEKGQVLATMDPTLSDADVVSLQLRLDTDVALIARLSAEYDNKPYIPGGVNSYNQVQLSIWDQRQAEYKANVGSLTAQIAAARGLIEQYQRDEEQYRKRYLLATRRQQMVEPLVAKGYVSELQLNTAKDSTEELSRELSDAEKMIQEQISTELSGREQLSVFIEHWHADVGSQLVAARNDLDSTQQALDKAHKLTDLNILVSPAPAIVLKIGKVSAGSVAGLGATLDPTESQLITLAPLDAPLAAEIDVDSEDVGFIRAGDDVALKFDAYDFILHGTAKGTIKSISEGSFTTDENGQPTPPYFKVNVAIDEVKLRDVPKDFRLIPGMTLTGDVLLGKRTILSYLISGVFRTGSEAMREAK